MRRIIELSNHHLDDCLDIIHQAKNFVTTYENETSDISNTSNTKKLLDNLMSELDDLELKTCRTQELIRATMLDILAVNQLNQAYEIDAIEIEASLDDLEKQNLMLKARNLEVNEENRRLRLRCKEMRQKLENAGL
ncbi:MAG: hypothetical protein ATN35_10725 [Epulopiscium sp. Nele67-Bin004]|nr:MAG: hypothetical protein ATN35_10725 [Epulopiscium sp. Nele67-Bin004]